MVHLSLFGLIGAIAGTVIAAVCYGPAVTLLERLLRAGGGSHTADDDTTSAQERAVLRRAVLALDLLLFAGLGYWLGTQIEG